jgi:hypothetical protein
MVPRRRHLGAAGGRIALVHALAHIELNAIDLAWDIVAAKACRANFTTIGSRSPPTRRSISHGSRRGSPISEPAMAICRRMTGCGKRRRPPTTC